MIPLAACLICISLSCCAGAIGSPKSSPVSEFAHAQVPVGPQPLRVLPLTIRTTTSNNSRDYQQEVVVPASSFETYGNSNLSNLLFTYPNGTPINAWIQSAPTNSCPSLTVWLNLSGVANRTIDLVLYSKEASLLGRASYLGEAPQLSPTYGEFDNGPRVFPFYNDFSGNTLNSSAWLWEGSEHNFTIGNGLSLGDNQWGGVLSNTTFDAESLAPGIDLNFSSSVYLDVAVGTNSHVRLVGGGDGQYMIADPYGRTNGSFAESGGYGFFSFWTDASVGHINLGSQTLGIGYTTSFGPTTGERLSIRSDSPGWIDVRYALLRELPTLDSGYMPEVGVSPVTVPLGEVGLNQVDFLESGLPDGVAWTLLLPNVSRWTPVGDSLSLALGNGSYTYLVSPANLSYSGIPPLGSFVVRGSNVSVPVSFGLQYLITFQAVGLPLGWLWSVRLSNNASSSSLSPQMTLRATNGTYNYSAQSADPSCAPSGGTFTITGPHAKVRVQFSEIPNGSQNVSEAEYLVSFIGVLALVTALVYLRHQLRH